MPWGCTPVVPYLKSLTPSGTLEDAWRAVARHEQTLLVELLGYLRSKSEGGVRIVGDEREGETRVPTVSFVVGGERPIRSKDVVAVFDRKPNVSVAHHLAKIRDDADLNLQCALETDVLYQVGIRYGHFYAYTLVDTLEPKLDVADGVVRISLVHYNTVEEVKRIIGILEEVLA